jgi:hypothetical protein
VTTQLIIEPTRARCTECETVSDRATLVVVTDM